MQGNGWLVTRALLVRPIRTEHAGVQDIQVFGKPQLRDITSLMSWICLLGILCSCKNTGWTDKRPVAICMVLIRMKINVTVGMDMQAHILSLQDGI